MAGAFRPRSGSDWQQILLDGKPYDVVGVMPATFQVPLQSEVWIPLSLPSEQLRERAYHSLSVVGRVREGHAASEAQAEMSAIAAALTSAHPESNTGRGVLVRTLKEHAVGNVRPILLALFGAVGFILLIACANIANLLLARSPERMREMAVRTALGASRAQLAGQMMVENVLLAVLGGAAGMGLAIVGLNALRLLSPGILPRAAEIGMKGDTLAFILALSLLSGLAFGSAPAYQLVSSGSMQPLNENSRSTAGSARGSSLRNALAVVQIALSLVLLVGADLMVKSLSRLQTVDPGFRPDHVITAQIDLPSARYGDKMQAALFFDTLLSELRATPGAPGAAAVINLPSAAAA